MPFFFPSCSLGCILLLLSVFFPGVFGADRNFTELSNKNGIDVCTMESKMLLLCDTNSQPSRRSGFPNPNPCSCNTIFFNLFCACQLSQGVTYRPGWTDFTARCNDAGMNVTQSTNYTLPFNMPLWVNQDAKDDRFDEDNAFRLVENTQDSSNQGLGPGTIVGIATGGVAVLAFLGFLIWKVRTTRRANQRHRKKNLGGWSSPFSTTFGFASRQTVTKKRKETQWAIDEEPDNAETYEILARPFTKNSAAPSLGAVHPHAPNSEINNPFNHNLAERAHHERNASTTSTLTPLSGWAAFRRKIRLAFYSMPLPGRNVVPVKHYKPSMAFQVDDRDGPYDPYLGGSKKSRNSGGSPQDPAHGRSTSQASFISAGGRPVSAYEELSEHFDLDTTGSRTNLAEGGAGRSGRTEEERLLEPSSSHGYQRTTTTPSTHGLYDYSPSSRPNSNPLPYGESTTAVYGGSSGNLLSGDVLDISRDNNLLASSSSGDRRANNISSSTVSSTASQRPERNNHNRKPSDRLQQRLPPAPSSLAPSPSSAQSFTSGHGRDASGSSSTFSQIPPLQPQVVSPQQFSSTPPPQRISPQTSETPSRPQRSHEQLRTANLPHSSPQLASAVSGSSMYTDNQDALASETSSPVAMFPRRPLQEPWRGPSPVPEEGTSTGSTTFPPPATPPFASSSSSDYVHAAHAAMGSLPSPAPSRTTTIETLPPYVARDSMNPGMLLHQQEATNVLRQPNDESGQRPVPPTLTAAEKGKLFNMDLETRRREQEERRALEEKEQIRRREEAEERRAREIQQHQQGRRLPLQPPTTQPNQTGPIATLRAPEPPSPSGSSIRALPPVPSTPPGSGLTGPTSSGPDRAPSASSSSSSNMYTRTPASERVHLPPGASQPAAFAGSPVSEVSYDPHISSPSDSSPIQNERITSLPPQLGPFRMMSYESMLPEAPDSAVLTPPPFSPGLQGRFASFMQMDSPGGAGRSTASGTGLPRMSNITEMSGTMQSEQWEEMTRAFPQPPS